MAVPEKGGHFHSVQCFIQYSADPEKWIEEKGAAEFFKTYRLRCLYIG